MKPVILRPVVIFGAQAMGAAARYLFETATGRTVAAFAVDREFAVVAQKDGLPVVPFDEVVLHYPPSTHEMAVAIGPGSINGIRRDRFGSAQRMGYTMASVVSARANVWAGFAIPEGCLVYEGAIVQAYVDFDVDVTIRSGANIGHHSRIGRHTFVASNVVTGGGCQIGAQVFIGLGAVIRDRVSIADRCFIGAGAVVLADTEPDGVYVGNPARRLPKSALETTAPRR